MKRPKKYSKEVANYLVGLRDSGAVNMFGASPYLEDEFGMSKKEAGDCLIYWIKSFNKGSKK